MKKHNKLSIIIVTFESSLVIRTCLEKINFKKYDVFVVDNNSQDDTTSIIKEDFPKVNLIKLNQNIGYGRANNIALRQANTDYALIINPDAFMFEKDLENAIKVMDENQNFAIASPNTFHNRYLNDLDKERKKVNKLTGKDRYTISNFIIGGVMFINMNIFRKIGFFDENIFMFSEDNEISQRSLDNGYKNVVINNSIAYHLGAGSSKKTLRTIYRRFWHLGWSKSYWKRRRKSWINVKRATLRLILIYLLESIFNIFKFNIEKVVSKFAFAMGCLAHFIGLKAFNKDGKARG